MWDLQWKEILKYSHEGSIRKFEKAWKDMLKVIPKEEEKKEGEKVITRCRGFLYGGW